MQTTQTMRPGQRSRRTGEHLIGGGQISRRQTRSGFLSIAVVFSLDPADERGIHARTQMLGRWRKALTPDTAFVQALAYV